jgi:FkbM family methyltransferase
MAVPFKKQVFSGLKKLWVPPQKISRYLYFRDVFSVSIGQKNFHINHYGFDVETSIFWYGLTGAWEKISMSVWIKLCERSRVIFDIGANTGVYSLVAKTVNPTSQVHSFEPVKRVFEKLVANNYLNQYNIDCQQVAISNYDGEGVIYDLPTEHIYSVTLNKNMHNAHLATAVRPTMVKAIRLDTFIKSAGLEHVDLLKIDVESHEPQVLEGMGNSLGLMHPTMLLEVWNDEFGTRIEKVLSGHGYLFFCTNEMQPFRPADHIRNPDPSKGYLSYLVCGPEAADYLKLKY